MYRGHIGNQGAYSFQAREIELEPVAVHSWNSILSMRTRLLLEQLYSDQQNCYSSQTLDTILAPSCLGGSGSGWDSYLVSSRKLESDTGHVLTSKLSRWK
ncbi:hypothetical protein DPMN_019148 [Dreissena polymorpha]|uniref:Uncharacterized protein n=1 Tax=Dreissena polymorpha TaxID=45954 RepID=A0A9D4S917_DREPO|nr:hypothetical protein DPMN_019148 [Dreissena polymorpha]